MDATMLAADAAQAKWFYGFLGKLFGRVEAERKAA